ncbi:TIR domain-containing protein [Klebsiella variicola]
MGEISVKTGNNARNGGKNSLNRLIRCVCGKKIGPDPRNFNQRVSLGRNDLLIRTFPNETSDNQDKGNSVLANNKVFIIHGHDGEAKEKTARFIEKLGLEAIILSEQANQGKTIIEKLEHYTDVGFAIVLYTGDDAGNTEAEAGIGNLNARARQNVVFEHGLLMGRLGRHKVIPLVSGTLELPSDIQGVVYINDKNWQLEVAREIKSAVYDIDMNKVL